jgi:6-phosphogluconolactonase (cycloisomerase 2 family)
MRNHKPLMWVVLLAMLAALGCTFGCGAGSHSTPPTSSTYAYVAMANPPNGVGCISQFRVSSSGTLTPLSPMALATDAPDVPFGGGPLAVDPSGQYLFLVGGGGQGAVSQYVIGADGAVTPNASPYSSAEMLDPLAIAINGGGLTVVTNGVVLSSYSLGADGTLTLLNSTPISNAHALVVDPSGRFIYIDEQAYNTFAVYGISADGTLTLNGTIPSEYLPWSLVFSPEGVLYSVDYGAGTITDYSIDGATGIPTKVESFSTGSAAGASLPQGMVFDPSGTYAYVTNQAENTVSQFAVDAATGSLRRNGPDIPTDRDPSPIAIDPSGKFVFVGTLLNGTISQFSVNADGTLSSNGAVPGGTNPDNPNTQNIPVAFAFAQR